MKDRNPQKLPMILAVLALAVLGAPVIAEEPPADEKAGEEEAVSTKNVLQWRTATEVDNFGYYVYRAESEDGPFERLNEDPIPGAGTTDEPSSYEFVDDDIDLYTTYWYYLESISMSGEKERFTPVFRKKAKLPRDGDEDGESAAGSGDEAADPDQG